MHSPHWGCESPPAVDGLSSYPPVCGQPCAANGRRSYAPLALGLRSTACRIRQTATELLPARLRPTVCGQRPPGLRTAAISAATHIRPCAANGRRARTRPSAANRVRPTPAGTMHIRNSGCDPPPCRRSPTRRPAANSLRPSAAWFMDGGHLGCYSQPAVYGKRPPSSYPPACGQQSAIFPSNMHQLSL